MMHMGRMIHADSEVNSDSASPSVVTTSTDSGDKETKAYTLITSSHFSELQTN